MGINIPVIAAVLNVDYVLVGTKIVIGYIKFKLCYNI